MKKPVEASKPWPNAPMKSIPVEEDGLAQKRKPAPATVGVRISKSIKVRAKTCASANDRDMREVLDEALDEYLKRRGT